MHSIPKVLVHIISPLNIYTVLSTEYIYCLVHCVFIKLCMSIYYTMLTIEKSEGASRMDTSKIQASLRDEDKPEIQASLGDEDKPEIQASLADEDK